VTNITGGTYNCSFSDTSDGVFGDYDYYNVTVNATDKNGYYNGTFVIEENAVALVTEPSLSTVTVSTPDEDSNYATDDTDDGWGEPWRFALTAYDDDSGTNNVSLWINRTGIWENINSTNFTDNSEPITFDPGYIFNASDIGLQYYKINITEQYGYTDEIIGNATVNKNDIYITYISGNLEEVNRTGSDTSFFQISIIDLDRTNEHNPAVEVPVEEGRSGTIWVTANGTQSSLTGPGTPTTTDASGYLNISFNPNSTIHEVGRQIWDGGLAGDAWYVDRNLSADDVLTRYVDIYGEIQSNLELPTYGQPIVAETDAIIRLNVSTDNSTLDIQPNVSVTIETTDNPSTGPWTLCTPIVNGTGADDGYYNCTWDTTGEAGGNRSLRVNISKSYYNSNSTVYTDWFEIVNTEPNQTVSNTTLHVDPPTGGWGENFTFSVNVNDTQGDNVSCYLYVTTDGGSTWQPKGDNMVTNTKNSPKCSVNTTFTSADIDTVNATFRFTINDTTPGNNFTTANQSGPLIEENDVIVNYTFGNNSEVNRSGSNITELIPIALQNQQRVLNSREAHQTSHLREVSKTTAAKPRSRPMYHS
jgi:hypothetical protein